jgi:hypothetical protein
MMTTCPSPIAYSSSLTLQERMLCSQTVNVDRLKPDDDWIRAEELLYCMGKVADYEVSLRPAAAGRCLCSPFKLPQRYYLTAARRGVARAGPAQADRSSCISSGLLPWGPTARDRRLRVGGSLLPHASACATRFDLEGQP